MAVSALLHPNDTIKVRLQTQSQLMRAGSTDLYYRGFSHAAQRIWAEEGFRGLWMRGLTASMMRELSYSSLRLGLYEPGKHFAAMLLHDSGESLWEKIAAGFFSGAIGSAIASPTDLIKIRFQSVMPGDPPRYKNTFAAFGEIFRAEGVAGLYKGVSPTIVRAGILTSAQLSSYDHTKYLLLKNEIFEEGHTLHLCAALVSGLVTTVAMNPVDVIKTRIMESRVPYKGPLDCFWKTVQNEGLFSLYKGFLPNYLRLGPHFVLSLPLFEAIRHFFGASYL